MIQTPVVLTPAVVEHFLGNAGLKNEFPFIRYASAMWAGTPSVVAPGCPSCRNKDKIKNKEAIVNTVKASLLSLPPDRRTVFKTFAGVSKIIVHTTVHGQASSVEI